MALHFAPFRKERPKETINCGSTDERRWRFLPSARRRQPGRLRPFRPPEAAKPYRVLARKYRPSNFADLIGQEAMVRTVSNAFETGRIPQAWILTGVRGVGKTTTRGYWRGR
jgi:hypothetical protein